MEFRPGTCTACKASFRIPASFTANMAKCSKCGGAVEIGPVTSDSKPAATPAAPPAPSKATSAPVAAAAARLAAKPDAAPAQPVPAKPLAPRPLATPAAAPKPAIAPKPASITPISSPAAKPAAVAPEPAAKVAPISSSKAKSSGTRAAVVAEEGEDKQDRDSRRKRLEKKRGPSPALIGGALVVFVAVLVGLYFAYSSFQKKEAAKMAKITAEKTQREAEQKAIDDARIAQAVKEEQEAEAAKAAKAKEQGKPDSGAVLAAETKPAEAVKAEETAKAAAKAAADAKPIEGFDLSTIPDFGPADGTTPEQWTELQALAATFVDLSAGARGAKAGNKLELTPKESFPALLNQMKKANLADDDGFRVAEMIAKRLEKMCRGNNFQWKYQSDANYVQFDQKAIKAWCDAWTKASTDEAFWKKLTKADAKPADEAGAGTPGKKIDDF
ncbi:MAG TPA: hypothetical protein VK843_09790 [Planctomycetota bacterium]|nr:hypothetical protein [Planctomycetota bacterium]